MQYTWNEIKQLSSSKRLPIQFKEEEFRYYVKIIENGYVRFCLINITTPKNSDQIDFEDNYKDEANDIVLNKVADTLEKDIINGSLTVSDSISVEAKVNASKLDKRKGIIITPINRTIYWGGSSDVTTSTGTPIFKNQSQFIAAGSLSVFLIASSGSDVDVRIVEVA